MATKPPDRPDFSIPRPGTKLTFHFWLKSTPEALSELDRWLKERAEGDVVWTLRDLIAEFILRYQMPKFGESSVRNWLEKHRTALYCRGRNPNE